MFTARFNQMCDFTIKPVELMRWEAASIVAHGGAVEVVDQPNLDGTFEPKAWSVIRETYRAIDELSPHLAGTTPFAEIGVLYSHRNWELQKELGKDTPASVAHDFAGACRLMADEHLPYDVLVEEQVAPATLKPLRVVVVPNTVSLHPETVRHLRDWCAAGGVLMFDYRTATRDHRSRPVAEPGFGLIAAQSARPAKVTFVQPVFEIENPYLRVTEMVEYRAAGATEPLGWLTPAALEETAERWVSHKIHPGAPTTAAAAVLGEFGRGAFVYCSWRVFKELLATDLRAIRQFVRGALGKRYEPLVTLAAPRTVEMIPYRTAQGLRVFLTHGVVGRPAGPWMATYGTQLPLHMNMDFVLPVHDLQVRVRSAVRRSRDMHGRPLKVSRDGAWWKIIVPKVEQYQVVDIEYEQP
jgi:hypothetical protein